MSGQPAPELYYTYDYNDCDHPSEVLGAFSQFYLSGLFTDVSLRGAAGRVFHCHHAMLAACSTYFRAMFTTDMRDRSFSSSSGGDQQLTTTTTIITLPAVQCDILGVLLGYTYTARARITPDTVQSLLEAADLMQLCSLKRACKAFLVRLLDVGNCLGWHVLGALQRAACRLIVLSGLEDLAQQEEFLELLAAELRSLLSPKNDVAPDVWWEDDDVLLLAVARWVTYDLDNCIGHTKDLLSSID
ncbi:hypothetical protein CRUP_030159 [Coryphaenoides rupestris]|nr:hypothetical protein CRUP_030159 [Coryphaenoides rupestris]